MLTVNVWVERLTTEIVSRSGSAATAVTPSGRMTRVPPLIAGGGSTADAAVSKSGGLDDAFVRKGPASTKLVVPSPGPPTPGAEVPQAPQATARLRASAAIRRQPPLRGDANVVVAMESSLPRDVPQHVVSTFGETRSGICDVGHHP